MPKVKHKDIKKFNNDGLRKKSHFGIVISSVNVVVNNLFINIIIAINYPTAEVVLLRLPTSPTAGIGYQLSKQLTLPNIGRPISH